MCANAVCVCACARVGVKVTAPCKPPAPVWVKAYWPALHARADLNADGKVDGRVKLGADYLCQVLRKRRPVLAVKEVVRIFVLGVAVRHHPNNMVRAAAGSEPELLSLRLRPGGAAVTKNRVHESPTSLCALDVHIHKCTGG